MEPERNPRDRHPPRAGPRPPDGLPNVGLKGLCEKDLIQNGMLENDVLGVGEITWLVSGCLWNTAEVRR